VVQSKGCHDSHAYESNKPCDFPKQCVIFALEWQNIPYKNFKKVMNNSLKSVFDKQRRSHQHYGKLYHLGAG